MRKIIFNRKILKLCLKFIYSFLRLYFEQHNIHFDCEHIRFKIQDDSCLKCCCSCSIKALRIFIYTGVEKTDLNKYAIKMFENDCFFYLEVGKLCLSFLYLLYPAKCLHHFYFLIKMKGHWVWFVSVNWYIQASSLCHQFLVMILKTIY